MSFSNPLGIKMSRSLSVLVLAVSVLAALTIWGMKTWHERHHQLVNNAVQLVDDLTILQNQVSRYHTMVLVVATDQQAQGDQQPILRTVNTEIVDQLTQQLAAKASSELEALWRDLETQWIEYTAVVAATAADSKVALAIKDVSAVAGIYEQIQTTMELLQEHARAKLSDSIALTTAASKSALIMFAFLVLALLALVSSFYLAIRGIGQQLGASPETLQFVARQLVAGAGLRDHDAMPYSVSDEGLLASFHDISLKFEEISTENILSKQFERDKIASVKIETVNEAETREDECTVEVQKTCTKTELECARALELQRQISDEYEQRIGALLSTVKSVSSGDLTQSSNVTGDDDIGQIARFQGKIIEKMQRNLQQFDDQAQLLKQSSGQLNSVNAQMRASSVQTAEQANLASSSAEEISMTVENVVLAVKEMSTSIREISEHSFEAAQVAEQAVTLAKDTDATVRQLGDSSTAIGAVIKVINSIAEQTNLLALNATIEAARAGEAGKGFAVVANEVKELAKETAKATEEIAQQIATIQSDSQDAVSAISDIGRIIDRVNEIQSTIAAAVEEQSVTTSEINRSIGDVSNGSSEIAQNVSKVAETAQSSLGCVDEAQSAVDQMHGISTDLGELVSSYRLESPAARIKVA